MQVYDSSVSENFFALLRVPSPSTGVASAGSQPTALTEGLRAHPPPPESSAGSAAALWTVAGLTRASPTPVRAPALTRALHPSSRRLAVLCLVLVPYLKGRLDALYESRYGSSSLLGVMRATAPATGACHLTMCPLTADSLGFVSPSPCRAMAVQGGTLLVRAAARARAKCSTACSSARTRGCMLRLREPSSGKNARAVRL
jgi:hypothetical protein